MMHPGENAGSTESEAESAFIKTPTSPTPGLHLHGKFGEPGTQCLRQEEMACHSYKVSGARVVIVRPDCTVGPSLCWEAGDEEGKCHVSQSNGCQGEVRAHEDKIIACALLHTVVLLFYLSRQIL